MGLGPDRRLYCVKAVGEEARDEEDKEALLYELEPVLELLESCDWQPSRGPRREESGKNYTRGCNQCQTSSN